MPRPAGCPVSPAGVALITGSSRGVDRAPRDDDAALNELLAGTPLRRTGEADEIAGAAVLLASDASRSMTGQARAVDGGVTI